MLDCIGLSRAPNKHRRPDASSQRHKKNHGKISVGSFHVRSVHHSRGPLQKQYRFVKLARKTVVQLLLVDQRAAIRECREAVAGNLEVKIAIDDMLRGLHNTTA